MLIQYNAQKKNGKLNKSYFLFFYLTVYMKNTCYVSVKHI